MSRPTSRGEAIKLLPQSVRLRLGGRCRTLSEVHVCCEVVRSLGGWAVVLVASECFCIPVQPKSDFDLADLVWYTCMCLGFEPDSKNGNHPSPTRNLWAVYISKVKVYEHFLHRYKPGAEVRPPHGATFEQCSDGCWWRGKTDLTVFPRKQNRGEKKVNVWFSDIWRDVVNYFNRVAFIFGRSKSLSSGMFNDEASAWLLWLVATHESLGAEAFALADIGSGRPKFLKLLNTFAKSLGSQRYDWGCNVCELNTLSGRGVAPVDVDADVRPRIDLDAFLLNKAAVCDLGKLRKCIKKVVASEIEVQPKWGDVASYWSRRWLYTKSGSHTRRIEDIMFGARLDLPSQPTRREFAEAVNVNVVAFGDPEVHAGLSMKEEHGKTRAIYGCDTRSYYTFDYLLRPVEAVWRNRRVLLDPGRRPQSVLYEELRSKSGCRYMLDFDDFNSQHELAAMRMVIEEACAGAPPDVLRWALDSWDAMYIHYRDEQGEDKCARMVGTLPSGHRATTFVNTILNAAYCLYVMDGEELKVDAFHCGDDVVMFGQDGPVCDIIKRFLQSPFRVNNAKQSVGESVGEFLRVAFTTTQARGYSARAIASTVSGNWVTENRLDRTAYVETLVRNLWTVAARSGCSRFGTVFISSLRRRVPELSAYADGLVTHSISWNGTPVLTAYEEQRVRVLRSDGGRVRVPTALPSNSHASDDFLHNHIDFALLKESGITPGQVRHALRRACVKPRGIGEERGLTVHSDDTAQVTTLPFNYLMRSHSRQDKSYGEAFNVLSQLFSKVHWRRIISAVRGVTSDPVSVTGMSEWPVCSNYDVPFSDAMVMRKRLSQCVNLAVYYPVRV